MTEISLHPVRTRAQRRQFAAFPWKIYREDPLWVPPLIPDRLKVIDPSQGVFFQRGEAEFWTAVRRGKPVGTICAAEDPPINQKRGKKECLFGFLEYIEDYQVFKTLIEQAISWGQEQGLDSLYGPWNLDYEDGYGVLVEGREKPPALMCGHSPEYYQTFMERFGFQPARAENLALEIALTPGPKFERLHRLADRVRAQKDIVIREADFEHWDSEIDHLHVLLNRALAHLNDHIGWRRDNLQKMLEPFKRIADPALILFADVGGETIGFLPGVPNLNETLIHVNGLRYPWDYLRLPLALRRFPPRGMTIKSILVLQEYWNTGVTVLLASELIKRAVDRKYRWMDLSITSADNPTSVLTAEKLGARIYKRWQIYRLDI
jgi:GNAT superfamily N-acetyltransferase